MAEGTRFAKMDDAIKSLNEFRRVTENQIQEINNSISRLVEVVNQRWEDRNDPVSRSTEMATTLYPHSNNNMPYRSMKIEVPRFDGTDVSNWIFKIEQFFQVHNTPEDQRITISSFHLEGPALSWFTWMHSNGFIESWKGFVKAIKFRFGPSLYEDNRDAWSKLQQTITVAIEQDAAPVEEVSTGKITTISINNFIPEVSLPALSGHIQGNGKAVYLMGEPQEDLSTMVQDEQDTTILEELNTIECSVVVGNSGLPEGHKFGMDLVIFPIQGADVVLGIQWLELLGSVVTNCKQLSIDFQENGKAVHLMGETQYSFILKEPSILASFRFLIFQIGDWVMVKLHPYKQKSLAHEDSELSTREDIMAQLQMILCKAQKRRKLQAVAYKRDVNFQEGYKLNLLCL